MSGDVSSDWFIGSNLRAKCSLTNQSCIIFILKSNGIPLSSPPSPSSLPSSPLLQVLSDDEKRRMYDVTGHSEYTQSGVGECDGGPCC